MNKFIEFSYTDSRWQLDRHGVIRPVSRDASGRLPHVTVQHLFEVWRSLGLCGKNIKPPIMSVKDYHFY